eukprot:Amastigsp_a847030_6.p4 type:complete len:147 gc:universal Amastigsp_a847030_6:1271-1711(+)
MMDSKGKQTDAPERRDRVHTHGARLGKHRASRERLSVLPVAPKPQSAVAAKPCTKVAARHDTRVALAEDLHGRRRRNHSALLGRSSSELAICVASDPKDAPTSRANKPVIKAAGDLYRVDALRERDLAQRGWPRMCDDKCSPACAE